MAMSDPQNTALLGRAPAQMAQAAEDGPYATDTGRRLKSVLLALTGGGHIAIGFVFFLTSQVGADELAWGAKVLGGIVFSGGLVVVVLTGAELFTSSRLTLIARASGRIVHNGLILVNPSS